MFEHVMPGRGLADTMKVVVVVEPSSAVDQVAGQQSMTGTSSGYG